MNSNCSLAFCVVLALLQVEASSPNSACDTVLHLLVINDEVGPEGSVQHRDIRLEILPAAQVAVTMINNDTSILPGYCLELMELVTEGCNRNTALVEFTKLITRPELNIVGVTGLFCKAVTEDISRFVGHPGIDLIQISGSKSPCFQDRKKYPRLYRMLPSSRVYIETLAGLMEQLNWSKVGFISSANHDDYYRKTAEVLTNIVNVSNIGFYGEFDLSNTPLFAQLKQLQYSGVKITFILLPAFEASELICAAYLQGLTWPNYAWIVADRSVEELFLSTQCDTQSKLMAAENIFLIQSQLEPDSDSELVSGNSYSEYHSEHLSTLALHPKPSLHSNLYSNVLYDSVWAFALALNSSVDILHEMNMSLKDYRPANFTPTNGRIADVIENELSQISFSGAHGLVKFDKSREVKLAVEIFQIRNATSVQIGHYDTVAGEVHIELDSLGTFPDDDLSRVYQLYPVSVTIILSTISVLCIVFTTGILILFIYYRNEPETKASSLHLSLCMFLGSYSLLIGTLTHTLSSGMVLNGPARPAVCIIIVGTTSIGLDLVLTTLFTKMLRVYRIFTYFGKTGKAWSDRVLLLVIFMIVLGKILLLIVWSAADTYQLEDMETYQKEALPPYYEVIQQCRCRYLPYWLSSGLLYSGIILTVLLLLAFKTRKIERENFKDTKKVNACILCLVILISLSAPLWWVLRVIDQPIASKLVVGAAYGMAAVLCQLFLLAPKTIPPFLRHVRNICCSCII